MVRPAASVDPSTNLVRVSPSGNHIVAYSHHAQRAYLWSNQGVIQIDTGSRISSVAFSDDAKTLRLVTPTALHSYALDEELKHQVRPHRLTCDLEPSLDDGTIPCRTRYGADFASLAPGAPDFRSVSLPELSVADRLVFKDGALQARVHPGTYVKWKPGEPRTTADTFPESQVRASTSEPISAGKRVIRARWLDGETALTDQNTILRKGEPELRIPYRSDESFVSFAGTSRSLLVADARGLAVFDLERPYLRTRIAESATRVAQSEDFRTIATVSNHGRSLSILRAPEWKALGAPIAVNGVRMAAFGPLVVELAVLDESGRLFIYDTSRPSKSPETYVMDPRIAVFDILFDPEGQCLYLGGNPVQVIRRRDGARLSMYVGLLDHGNETEATLLFRDETDHFEGDPRLAKRLFCGDTPLSCPALNNASKDVVSRFFEATAESKSTHAGPTRDFRQRDPATASTERRSNDCSQDHLL